MIKPSCFWLVCALPFALTAFAHSAYSAKRYAALAVVPQHGAQYHGYAKGDSKRNAQAGALKACGNRRCRVVQQYRPGECVNIVLGNEQIWWDNTYFTRQASDYTLATCRSSDRNCRRLIAESCPGENLFSTE